MPGNAKEAMIAFRITARMEFKKHTRSCDLAFAQEKCRAWSRLGEFRQQRDYDNNQLLQCCCFLPGIILYIMKVDLPLIRLQFLFNGMCLQISFLCLNDVPEETLDFFSLLDGELSLS
jgi:hypothetical protein